MVTIIFPDRGHRLKMCAKYVTSSNRERFPADFMFQLSAQEAGALRSQIATSKTPSRGGRRYLPYAFTEHGAIMAASILNSPRPPSR